MAEVQIPPVELVDVASLGTDGQNPNRMSEKQHRALKKLLVAGDSEHRVSGDQTSMQDYVS